MVNLRSAPIGTLLGFGLALGSPGEVVAEERVSRSGCSAKLGPVGDPETVANFPKRRASQAGAARKNAAPPETEAFRNWETTTGRSLPAGDLEESEARVAAALAATRAFLSESGILFREKTFSNGKTPAIVFLPGDGHALNRLAKEMELDLPGIDLVYAPSVLMRGSAGFFSETDSALGISHAMLSNGVPDETFHHEVIHAAHSLARKKAILDPLNAVASVKGFAVGHALSRTRDGYVRLMTFEEVEAYAESLAVLGIELGPFSGRKLGREDYELLEELLGDIRFAAETGLNVSVQTRSIVDEAISGIPADGAAGWTPVASGGWKHSAELSAYEAKVGGVWLVHPGGAELAWRLGASDGAKPELGAVDLKRSLEFAGVAADRMTERFRRVKDSIAWLIERADAKKTDLAAVLKAIGELDAAFVAWKADHGKAQIPVLFDGK